MTLVALWRGSMSVSFCLSRSRASGSSSYALRSSLKCDSCSARRLDGVNTTCAVCHNQLQLLWQYARCEACTALNVYDS